LRVEAEETVFVIDAGSVLREVCAVVEETVFIIETGSLLCKVRVEAEETVQHRACRMVIINVAYNGL